MGVIRGFRDLEVYRMALRSAHQIFEATQEFPQEEKYALTDQVRRASRAVGAMIAEAWARRRYEKALVNKINEALGEAVETQAWLDHARMCAYLDQETYGELDAAWQSIGAMLNRMIQRAPDFCKPAVPKHDFE